MSVQCAAPRSDWDITTRTEFWHSGVLTRGPLLIDDYQRAIDRRWLRFTEEPLKTKAKPDNPTDNKQRAVEITA